MSAIPSQTGSYAVEFVLPDPIRLRIGRLGEFPFPAGHYIYLGSAGGPGGLRARLSRHLNLLANRQPHWHIDTLHQYAHPAAVCWWIDSPERSNNNRTECLWSLLLSSLPDSQVPVPGFGASDCKSGCPAHLFLFPGCRSIPVLSASDLRRKLTHSASSGEEMEPDAIHLHFKLLLPEVQ